MLAEHTTCSVYVSLQYSGSLPYFYLWLKEQSSAIDSCFIYTQATEAILVELGKEGEILRQSTQQIYEHPSPQCNRAAL